MELSIITSDGMVTLQPGEKRKNMRKGSYISAITPVVWWLVV